MCINSAAFLIPAYEYGNNALLSAFLIQWYNNKKQLSKLYGCKYVKKRVMTD